MAYRSDYRSFFLPLLMLLAVNAGCGYLQRSPPSHDAGVELMAQGRYEEGLSQLERAAKEQPGNLKIRTDLINLKEQAIARLLAAAADERTAGHLRSAGEIYQRVMKIDSTSERARAGLVEMERDRRHADILLGASTRSALGLYRASQAIALMRGRGFVVPDDVKNLAKYVLAHRIMPRSAGGSGAIRVAEQILGDILDRLIVPE